MKLCVYCGSSIGNSRIYQDAARQLANAMVQRGIDLVYGGANLGLMKIVADTILSGGGHVTGVIPDLLATERAHPGLSELHVVDSMHARKTKMFELSDAFVALPGGYGTLEEIIEQLTWAQLGIHPHPCGILNINGYYDYFVKFLDTATQQGFIKPDHRHMLTIANTPEDLFAQFEKYKAPKAAK
ncbi:MAG: TIGR00730 family Rossman fold protein [Deltaproteobacteria bacterium]|nr:TIGR00730 family Rossman fold protein [Deltaproteobacteria bacterium]